jgi:hypothetical protein
MVLQRQGQNETEISSSLKQFLMSQSKNCYEPAVKAAITTTNSGGGGVSAEFLRVAMIFKKVRVKHLHASTLSESNFIAFAHGIKIDSDIKVRTRI